MTNESLSEWEQKHIHVLTSRQMGAWLGRRENRLLDKIRAEIEKAIWEDILPIRDETGEITDEIRIPLLDPDDVFEIIDKYKAESGGKG